MKPRDIEIITKQIELNVLNSESHLEEEINKEKVNPLLILGAIRELTENKQILGEWMNLMTPETPDYENKKGE